MPSRATTVDAYLAELPEDRRAAIATLREVFRKNLDPKITECMSYGMIGYAVPHAVYPPGYHCDPKQPLPYAGLASQKGHLSLYLMALYMDPAQSAWFQDAWTKAGKKLDMGAACVRFKRIEDVPLDVVAEALRRVPVKSYVEQYEANLAKTKSGKKTLAAKSKTSAPKTSAPKTSAPKASAPKTKAATSAGKAPAAKKGAPKKRG